MWSFRYSTKFSGVGSDNLWKAVADINSWNHWSQDVEWTKLEGEPKEGKDFFLKPKGEPKVRITISEAKFPNRFSDVTHLPGAKMNVVHSFQDVKEGTEVEILVTISGPLGFLWKKIIGESQAKGMPEELVRLAEFAKGSKYENN
ncbi:polyketide cyclase [Leptospira perolatii]|uniref:Polyketide cyclase n=1 Tax=Leptospira perolatii TaxID=2023191 RepID=A0A2M9ZNM6_9LEPT|nr:SRPBCC family protein [Leptospira perolatii]PJZ69604.1 polyketide cyclase [Leptospira perolatii]PJZ73591.1 polyketide cyclase [Leptospira perolatii]